MSLDPGNQFNEAGTSAADFDPQDQVLPGSPGFSADVNTIAERALRRTRHLFNDATHVEPQDLATVVTLTVTAIVANDMLQVDVANVEVGDWVTWAARALVSTINVGGTLSFAVVEDVLGTPSSATPPGCTQPFAANVTDALGVVTGQYEVTMAGQFSLFLQGRVDSAGVGNQLSINAEARLDVVHVRPIR